MIVGLLATTLVVFRVSSQEPQQATKNTATLRDGKCKYLFKKYSNRNLAHTIHFKLFFLSRLQNDCQDKVKNANKIFQITFGFSKI
jgi:hypothetical protein